MFFYDFSFNDPLNPVNSILCELGAMLVCCLSGSFLTKALEEFEKKTKYDMWFVGHHHRDIETVRKVRFIYKDFVWLA